MLVSKGAWRRLQDRKNALQPKMKLMAFNPQVARALLRGAMAGIDNRSIFWNIKYKHPSFR